MLLPPYFNAHSHKISLFPDKEIVLLNQYPEDFDATVSFCSLGIHPWHVGNDALEKRKSILSQNVGLSQVKAIGECGLDNRIAISMLEQIAVFEFQIDLAIALQKPLILHCVGAFDIVMRILKQKKFNNPVLFHGFSKNEALASQLMAKGYYISFGKYLFQHQAVRDAFAKAPLNQLFLETDNADVNIEEVYALAAEIKQMDLVNLRIEMYNNKKRIFG
jgi:TatD DNase family protein